MSFEKREAVEKPEPLDEDEAHLEANMLRVRLREIVGHEPTADDYEKAFRAVEEVKRLAEEEPHFDKILFKVARIGNKYFNDTADGLLWILSLGRRPNEQDKDVRAHSLRMFEDASVQLETLRRKAESEEAK